MLFHPKSRKSYCSHLFFHVFMPLKTCMKPLVMIASNWMSECICVNIILFYRILKINIQISPKINFTPSSPLYIFPLNLQNFNSFDLLHYNTTSHPSTMHSTLSSNHNYFLVIVLDRDFLATSPNLFTSYMTIVSSKDKWNFQ